MLRKGLEATPGIEPGCADLQSATSPLRHVANPPRDAEARKECAVYHTDQGLESTRMAAANNGAQARDRTPVALWRALG
jgi:hypothetical protein